MGVQINTSDNMNSHDFYRQKTQAQLFRWTAGQRVSLIHGKNGNGKRATEKKSNGKTATEDWATGKLGNGIIRQRKIRG